MRAPLLVLIVSLQLAACASTPDIHRAWAQTPEEAGRLPVGIVVSVEPEETPSTTRTSAGTAAGISGAVGPIVGSAAVALIDGLRPGSTSYRHSIRLKTSGEIISRMELAPYKVGDCVALRAQPEFVVPALPGACD